MPMTKENKQVYDAARYRTLRDANRVPDVITSLPETAAAYLAGLTDGDGSIFVTHTNRLRTYYPCVCWAMTDHGTISRVSELLRGTTVQHNNHTGMARGETSWGRSVFKWQWRTQVTGARAVLLCQRMLPYMITKAKQAEIVCTWPADERRAPGRRLSEEVRQRRVELGEMISSLNHS